jgi:hypothetical protein
VGIGIGVGFLLFLVGVFLVLTRHH